MPKKHGLLDLFLFPWFAVTKRGSGRRVQCFTHNQSVNSSDITFILYSVLHTCVSIPTATANTLNLVSSEPREISIGRGRETLASVVYFISQQKGKHKNFPPFFRQSLYSGYLGFFISLGLLNTFLKFKFEFRESGKQLLTVDGPDT
jgi:hypothetical protein